jgi:hypothetical protein
VLKAEFQDTLFGDPLGLLDDFFRHNDPPLPVSDASGAGLWTETDDVFLAGAGMEAWFASDVNDWTAQIPDDNPFASGQ